MNELMNSMETKMAINVGSSSIKTSVFYNLDRLDININFIGLRTQKVKLQYNGVQGVRNQTFEVNIRDDLRKAAAITIDKVAKTIEKLRWPKPSVIGHRVKFAGFGKAVEPFTEAIEAIMQFNDYLSSRHNHLCLKVLEECKLAFPDASQLLVRDQAVDDLSLHREHRVPFDHAFIKRYGLIAHGYHGLAIKACLDKVKQYIQTEKFSGTICQVGSGVSFSAVDHGQVTYNTMQYAACDGPIMHNRMGTQPAGITLRLLKYGLDPSTLSSIYNRTSGIYGLAGLPSDSTITVEDILTSPKFIEAKQSYLKANGVELFRTIIEAPNASNFIFSGGLATKHRWLGPALLQSAKAISRLTMEKLAEQLADPSAHTVQADGITLHLVEIDEQTCILNELEKASDTTNSLDWSKGICEVPGSAIATVQEGKCSWGPGNISLCLPETDFIFDSNKLPEAYIMVGPQRSDFFFRASYARNFGVPAIFIGTDIWEAHHCLGKKIYLDTPTRTAVIL
ncbi:Acetate kinase [compost metagenome]